MTIYDVIAIVALVAIMLVCDATSRSSVAFRSPRPIRHVTQSIGPPAGPTSCVLWSAVYRVRRRPPPSPSAPTCRVTGAFDGDQVRRIGQAVQCGVAEVWIVEQTKPLIYTAICS